MGLKLNDEQYLNASQYIRACYMALFHMPLQHNVR